MIMVQDQREKRSHHNNIEFYCAEHGLQIIRKRLNVGDYRLADVDECGNIIYLNNISVDVKGGGLAELAQDLYRDKLAFNKKYKKCLIDGIKLVVLIEEEVKSLSDLVSWRSKHTRITGRFLLMMMETVKRSFGVEFYFCKKEDTGENIIRLLKGDNMKPNVNDRVIVCDNFSGEQQGTVKNISKSRGAARKYAVEIMTMYNPKKIIFVSENQIKEIITQGV